MEQPSDAIPALYRMWCGGHFAASIAIKHSIICQQVDQIVDVSILARREKAVRQLISLFTRRFESWLPAFNVAFRAREYLAAVVFAFLDDFGNLVVAVVEYFA